MVLNFIRDVVYDEIRASSVKDVTIDSMGNLIARINGGQNWCFWPPNPELYGTVYRRSSGPRLERTATPRIGAFLFYTLFGLILVLGWFRFICTFILTAETLTKIMYAFTQLAGHFADPSGTEQKQNNYQNDDQFRGAEIAKHGSFFRDEFTTTE